MLKVRTAEQQLRLGTLHKSVSKTESIPTKNSSVTVEQSRAKNLVVIQAEDPVEIKANEILEDIVTEEVEQEVEEEVLDEVYEKQESEEVENQFETIEEKAEDMKSEAAYEFVELLPEMSESISEPPLEPPTKKQKKNPTQKVQTPLAIIYTHYELEAYKENDQNVIVINTYPVQMHLPKSGTYEFDTSWINHKPEEPTIFKCKLCVKAFSNVEFLLKHNLSCHHCLTCSQMFEGYKELTQHSREHLSVICHFCGKVCGSSSNFRQHLKRQHLLLFPSHIGILDALDSNAIIDE